MATTHHFFASSFPSPGFALSHSLLRPFTSISNISSTFNFSNCFPSPTSDTLPPSTPSPSDTSPPAHPLVATSKKSLTTPLPVWNPATTIAQQSSPSPNARPTALTKLACCDGIQRQSAKTILSYVSNFPATLP